MLNLYVGKIDEICLPVIGMLNLYVGKIDDMFTCYWYVKSVCR